MHDPVPLSTLCIATKEEEKAKDRKQFRLDGEMETRRRGEKQREHVSSKSAPLRHESCSRRGWASEEVYDTCNVLRGRMEQPRTMQAGWMRNRRRGETMREREGGRNIDERSAGRKVEKKTNTPKTPDS